MRQIPVKFVWKSDWGGCRVLVAGEFNGWADPIEMARDSNMDFQTVVFMPPGRYMVKYIVDNEWRLAANLPTEYDMAGHENNVIVVEAPIRKQSYQTFEALVTPARPNEPSVVCQVIEYKDKPWTEPDCCVDGCPQNVSLRPFDVTVSPDVETPEDEESMARVSSYNILVDMTADKFSKGKTSENVERIRSGIRQALSDQTRTLLLDARQKLKTLEEQKVCFSAEGTHPDLQLSDTRMSVTRGTSSTYRSARIAKPILPRTPTYFEILLQAQYASFLQRRPGTFCVGFSTEQTPLGHLVGSQPNTLGLYSTGDVISGGHWIKYARPFSEGSTVGVLATYQPLAGSQWVVECSFLVDGHAYGPAPAKLIVDSLQQIYPTVTLYSPQTMATLQGIGIEVSMADKVLELCDNVHTLDGQPLTPHHIERRGSATELFGR
eukprot:c14131_g1_i1.p1 GENE.c14131_g1_i1~~c14131_g1_i1.p1  ORF type:complete len:435 (-),score=84.46 c14131_g1_i1:1169-2473(-)